MDSSADLLPLYLAHLQARLRTLQGRHQLTREEREAAVLPTVLAGLSRENPRACLDLIVRALGEPIGPEAVRAVGNELLENLLNEHYLVLVNEVGQLLRSNKRFRQAFSCGNHASVDPAVIAEWVGIFESLGTTRSAERKSLWKAASN